MPPRTKPVSNGTEKDLKMYQAILESQIGTPKIDFHRLAQKMEYRNARVAQDSYHRFRAKMRGDVNYGNARGRAMERVRRKLAVLEGDDEEEMDDYGVGGEAGSEGFPSVLTGESALRSVLDAQGEGVASVGEGTGEGTREELGESSGAVSKEKEKQVQVKKEVEVKQESWEWSGADVSWIDVPV